MFQEYGKIWSGWLDHFIKHISLVSEEYSSTSSIVDKLEDSWSKSLLEQLLIILRAGVLSIY